MNAFVGRQAIFDRKRNVYGYELLFRSCGTSQAFDGTDDSSATRQVIENSMLTIGLAQLVGEKRAFVNFGREMLLAGMTSVLPKNRTVIEILETVEFDAEVLAACQDLKRQGYLLALDDYVIRPECESLLQEADFVKIEIRSLCAGPHKELVRELHARGQKAVAEKVETHEEFTAALRAGYDYFQGFFLAKPTLHCSQQVPATKLSCLRLLREITTRDLDFVQLDQVISSDVSLSYKLLRYVNSAVFAHASQIGSIRQALVIVGEAQMRRWVALVAIPKLADDKPVELLSLSLIRARMCESVARLINHPRPEQAFLTGLFSFLDALIDKPLKEALAEIHLSPPILTILLGDVPNSDPLNGVYRLVCCYEKADWDGVLKESGPLHAGAMGVQAAYLEAVRWTRETLNTIAK